MISAWAGVARAPFLLLPVALIAVGAAVAHFEGSFDAAACGVALVGLLALHVAVNSLNEASDFVTGIDLETERTPFSGGSGTLPAGRLSARAANALGIGGAAVGLAVGVYFLARVGPVVLPIFVLGAASVLLYSGVLARAYVGEVAAGLGLGALPVLGTVLVQMGSLGPAALWAAMPAFFMTFDLLLLNEFPDDAADRRGGRRNLVLLLGRPAAALLYLLVALAVPASLVAAVVSEGLPLAALVAVVPSLALAKAARWALSRPQEAVPIPALAANVAWNLSTNFLLAGALVLSA